MPHLTLHYTANVDGFDPDAALREINHRLADSGHFDEAAIKSRALRLDHYRVGIAEDARGFVHAQLRILPGRDADTRAALSALVLDALQATLPYRHPHTQLCVEVDEMDARSYSKRVFDAQSD
ncbi:MULTISPECIES: 5-carboxymethyl-2-hydroxymuconate Delta-isomerase [unclassified Lysobacter]|uniref:5-carboxymethyl-2-hydroxymuconate Delta-isomerase n=1 Tax=unclassified Lysobacter TaxID=2635362 RepID=UPI001C22D7CB|nr:5-carboxymethyl-2-hydroxymuconate Delta-isomerase [Lysobacter sp. MMG2]MBU8978106.1 5-carboxymethyl-2-hydroxymuconate Delta-isomerase [Lysobacter sp. MMG2]